VLAKEAGEMALYLETEVVGHLPDAAFSGRQGVEGVLDLYLT
jgi:hypothetical protein